MSVGTSLALHQNPDATDDIPILTQETNATVSNKFLEVKQFSCDGCEDRDKKIENLTQQISIIKLEQKRKEGQERCYTCEGKTDKINSLVKRVKQLEIEQNFLKTLLFEKNTTVPGKYDKNESQIISGSMSSKESTSK